MTPETTVVCIWKSSVMKKTGSKNTLIDSGGSWVFGWVYTWFVGVDGGTEASCVSYVVDHTSTSIGIRKSIGAYFVSSNISRFSAEGSAAWMAFIITEMIVTYEILSTEVGASTVWMEEVLAISGCYDTK